jgi:hypothetical protein
MDGLTTPNHYVFDADAQQLPHASGPFYGYNRPGVRKPQRASSKTGGATA